MKALPRTLFARLANSPRLAAGLLALAAVSGHAQTSADLPAVALLPGGINALAGFFRENPSLGPFDPAVFTTDPTVQPFLRYPYTYNERQVANRLVGVLLDNPNPGLVQGLANAIALDVQNGTVTRLPYALDTLAANQYTMLRYVQFSNTENFFRNIDARLAAIRFGTQGFATAGYTQSSWAGAAAPSEGKGMSDGKEAKAPVTAPPPPPSEPKFGVWVVGNGNLGTLDTGGGVGIDRTAADFDFYGGGGLFGIDYKLRPDFAIGLAAGYEYTHISPKQVVGSAHTQQVEGEFYATYGGPVGLYVNGIVGGGYSWNDVHREVFGTQAFSSPQAAEFNTQGEVGYQIKINERMGITPFGQVLYDHLWNSGAAEKGSVANLSIRHGTADTLLSVAGAKFIWVCHLGGIRLTNTVWGGWRHEFLTPYYSVNATFRGFDSLGAFETRGARFGHESFTGGIGVNADVTTNVSVNFDYDVQANDSFQSHFFNLGLTYKF